MKTFAIYVRVGLRPGHERPRQEQIDEQVREGNVAHAKARRGSAIGSHYVETEPVMQATRPALEQALAEMAPDTVLVVPRLGHLARSDTFIDRLIRTGAVVLFPEIPGWTPTPMDPAAIRALKAWAYSEVSRKISRETRVNMARSDTPAGGDRGQAPSDEAREKSRTSTRERSDEVLLSVQSPLLAAYAESRSYTRTAYVLNRDKVRTLSGRGKWHAQGVKRALEKIKLLGLIGKA